MGKTAYLSSKALLSWLVCLSCPAASCCQQLGMQSCHTVLLYACMVMLQSCSSNSAWVFETSLDDLLSYFR